MARPKRLAVHSSLRLRCEVQLRHLPCQRVHRQLLEARQLRAGGQWGAVLFGHCHCHCHTSQGDVAFVECRPDQRWLSLACVRVVMVGDLSADLFCGSARIFFLWAPASGGARVPLREAAVPFCASRRDSSSTHSTLCTRRRRAIPRGPRAMDTMATAPCRSTQMLRHRPASPPRSARFGLTGGIRTSHGC